VIVLAHNAFVNDVNVDFGVLMDAEDDSVFMVAVGQVVDQVNETRKKAAK
jgi:hypothetical protein